MPTFTQPISTFTDYGAQAQDIERQRKMAELLQQQGMQPIEPMAPNAPISWTQGLAKMLQAYGGRKGQDVATESQKALADRARIEAMNWASSMPQGTPGVPESFTGELGDELYHAPIAPKPADRNELMAWVLKGGMSGNPMAAQLAGPFMTSLMKQDEPYSLREGERRFGPGNIQVAENPKIQPGFTLSPEQTHYGPGGMGPDASLPMNTPKAIPDNWMQQLPPGVTRQQTDPAGIFRMMGPDNRRDVYQAEFENGKYIGARKLDNASRISLNANMPPQERAFEAGLGTGQSKELLEGRNAADDATQIIRTVHQGRAILKSGMITGFGANAIVSIGQALKQAGIDFGTNDPIANAQAYTANMAGNVGKIIKQFGSGTGLSDADREYATKMAGGQITVDKAAIEKILDINERQARWVIERHNKRVAGVKTNIPLIVDAPPPYQEASDTGLPSQSAIDAEIARRKGGRK